MIYTLLQSYFKQSRVHSLTFFAIMFVLQTMILIACPNCKDGYDANSHEAAIGESYSWSVLFMLAMIYTVGVCGILLIIRAVRKAQALRVIQQQQLI